MSTAGNRTRDRYRPEALIATGGMGEVWRATDIVLEREVALKILKAEYAGDPDFRRRFTSEARHAASLQHPGIAAVFDFGELSPETPGRGGRPFLVMELVHGQPLSDLLRSGSRMDPAVARDLVLQAADALSAAHATGLVHRDVKPANLLVTPDHRVKVTDFGIARAADGVSLTRTGQLVGTPQYLSPEQADGRVATAASDVYALGVVLFECLSGHQPFRGETPVGTALAHLRQPVPELPADVPADLAAITRTALAKDPADRYADAGALADALRGPRSAPADPTLVLPAPRGAGAEERRGRVPAWWPVALMGLLAIALVVGLALAGAGDDQHSRRQPQSPAQSPAGSPAQVRVRASDYLGKPVAQVREALRALGLQRKPVAQVREALRALGLQARVAAHRDNPGDQTAGTVAALTPTGKVAKDSTIRLTVWSAPAPPATTRPEPKKPPGAKKPGPGKKGPGKGPGPGPGKDHGKHKGKGKGH